jgi:DNA-binding response OmpR family regulator
MQVWRVLLIDDEKGFTDMVSVNLEQSGKFKVGVENEPLKAVDTAREFAPDIVVLDIVMPKKNGYDILSSFSKEPKLKNVPVIVLTALVSNDETSGAAVVRSGGEVILAKPVSSVTLIETIEARLTGRG